MVIMKILAVFLCILALFLSVKSRDYVGAVLTVIVCCGVLWAFSAGGSVVDNYRTVPRNPEPAIFRGVGI